MTRMNVLSAYCVPGTMLSILSGLLHRRDYEFMVVRTENQKSLVTGSRSHHKSDN